MMGTGEAAQGQIVQGTIAQEIEPRLPHDGIGGAAVAVRIDGRTLFFNYGSADIAQKRPITSDSLFNVASIRKVFEATVVAQAFAQSDLAFDDPVSRYVTELQQGGDIRRVTVGQLATHTSGLLLPADHPPWVTQPYTLAEFIRTLNDWKLSEGQEPGRQRIYTHAGYVLLQLVLERRFGRPIAALLDDQVIAPLGLSSTMVPPRAPDGRAELAPALMSRAVQGYAENGEPVGKPGDQQTYYDFPGTGQMFSSAGIWRPYWPPTLANGRPIRRYVRPCNSRSVLFSRLMRVTLRRWHGRSRTTTGSSSWTNPAVSTIRRPISASFLPRSLAL